MATDVENPVAESSTATEQSPAEIDLSSLSPEQRQTWRETGEVPQKPSKEESATSSEAASEDQAEKISPAPEAEKDSQERKDSKPKPRSNAETRVRELLAEKKRLETELAEARKPKETKPAESSPAEPKPVQLEAPKKPKYEDFQTFEEYDAAKDKYFEDLTEYKSKKAVEDFQRNQTQQAQQKVLNEQVSEARKLYTDFDDKAGPVLKAVFDDANVHQAVKEAINRSPVLPHLLYAIGGKGELTKLVEAAKSDPLDAIRQINIYEYLVMQELEKPKGNGKAKESEEEESPAQTVTRVPKPPSEIGGRATSTEDPGVAAARANDFRGAKAEWNRRAREGRIH